MLPRTRLISLKEGFDSAAVRVLHSRPFFVFSTSLALTSLASLVWVRLRGAGLGGVADLRRSRLPCHGAPRRGAAGAAATDALPGSPGTAYTVLEVVINALVRAVVVVRLYVSGGAAVRSGAATACRCARDAALAQLESLSNVVDVSAILVCILSLVVLTMECGRAEKLGDLLLLLLRNGVQIARLGLMLKK
jgi:hypothetical protein